MEISIHSIVLGMVQTNCYLITNEDTKETVIVDPAVRRTDCAVILTVMA